MERKDNRHGEAACLKSNLHNMTTDHCLKDFERGSFECWMLRADVPCLIGQPLVLIVSSECFVDSVVRGVSTGNGHAISRSRSGFGRRSQDSCKRHAPPIFDLSSWDLSPGPEIRVEKVLTFYILILQAYREDYETSNSAELDALQTASNG